MTHEMAVRAWGHSRRRGRLFLLGAMLIAAAHFASFDIIDVPVFTDTRYYLYYASQIARGAVPHLDYFDNKTQLSSFAGALLFRAGRLIHVEPLYAIRAGYLALAGLAGVTLFVVLRILANGRNLPGLFALLIYSGFALLGFMPSIGNVPKLLMALCASLAAICVHKRRWVLAGMAASLAFMDWQIGILALLATLCAAISQAGDRLRAGVRTLIGAAVCLAPVVVYYIVNGALLPAYRNVVGAALARGADSLEKHTWPEQCALLLKITREACSGHMWLVCLGIVGLFVFPLWIARSFRRRWSGMVLALAVYHYGVVAFTFFDFQGFGDLFLVLHSLAFFGAIAFAEILGWFSKGLSRLLRGHRTRNNIVAVLGVITALSLCLAVRPSILRPYFNLTIRPASETTLQEQRHIYRTLFESHQGRKMAFAALSEFLFIGDITNDLPFIYWNAAAYARFRASPDESEEDALYRLVIAAQPDVIVIKLSEVSRRFLPAYRFVVAQTKGRYRAFALVRND